VGTESKGWVAARFGRLSTGLKMLFWISLGLFPLGLIAILASVDSARENLSERHRETAARLELRAQKLDAALDRSEIAIDAASAAIAVSPETSSVCETSLRRLEAGPAPALYALYARGNMLRCASPGMSPPAAAPAGRPGERNRVEIGPESLRLYLFDETGGLEGISEHSRAALGMLTEIPNTNPNFDLELSQGSRRMLIRKAFLGGPLVRPVSDSRAVAGGRLRLSIVLGAPPISAAEALTILLPVMMWLFACLIGWLIIDRMLLRPLAGMQRAVSAYQPGDRELAIPSLATPAREIGDLGEAFDRVVKTVARHEANLETAVERQTRLVREVHHRVKNNLQVVASLLNLHSRGSPNEEVAAAYASIQRRVDALAVVHRNHFAELEDNKGVALKPLISELAANLRATAPLAAVNMGIRLDIEPYYVNQDVAVSVAFLITELVEYAMFRGASSVAVALRGDEGVAGTATLIVESASLVDGGPSDDPLSDRFERIVTGLSRQLRSTIDRDQQAGRYSIAIAVVQKGER
jgi:two-component sensor histidine kinase